MFDLVITSGGFDPVHVGHLDYLEKAKNISYNTHHICIVNNDEFLKNKKGYKVMSQNDRARIVYSLRFVDEVFVSQDSDSTVCESIKAIVNRYGKNPLCKNIYFAKGGDRNKNEIPERKICEELGVIVIDGLGEKIRSSSKLMEGEKSVC